jgi:hypothetical protein
MGSTTQENPLLSPAERHRERDPSTPREMRFAHFPAPLRMTTLEWAAFDDSTRAERDKLE